MSGSREALRRLDRDTGESLAGLLAATAAIFSTGGVFATSSVAVPAASICGLLSAVAGGVSYFSRVVRPDRAEATDELTRFCDEFRAHHLTWARLAGSSAEENLRALQELEDYVGSVQFGQFLPTDLIVEHGLSAAELAAALLDRAAELRPGRYAIDPNDSGADRAANEKNREVFRKITRAALDRVLSDGALLESLGAPCLAYIANTVTVVNRKLDSSLAKHDVTHEMIASLARQVDALTTRSVVISLPLEGVTIERRELPAAPLTRTSVRVPVHPQEARDIDPAESEKDYHRDLERIETALGKMALDAARGRLDGKDRDKNGDENNGKDGGKDRDKDGGEDSGEDSSEDSSEDDATPGT